MKEAEHFRASSPYSGGTTGDNRVHCAMHNAHGGKSNSIAQSAQRWGQVGPKRILDFWNHEL